MPERKEKRSVEKEGVFFLIYNNGKVLLEERKRPDKPYFGYITIPGGGVDGKDLNHFEAAKREAKEECGIEAKEIILLDNFLQMSISNHLYNVSAFLISSYGGEVTNPEGKSNHIWATFDEALKMVSFVETRYILLKAKIYLTGKDR